jgi:pSer/pThr/pTyr-binding forkhead associated (FHA) protein
MYLEDMGSTNGTVLNGRRVRTAERLRVGDVIRIGDSEYRYQE